MRIKKINKMNKEENTEPFCDQFRERYTESRTDEDLSNEDYKARIDKMLGLVNDSHLKAKADRHNSGKPQWSLLDFKALEPMVRVMEAGANKYAPDNWKKGFEKKDLLDCMMRHFVALSDGEELDKETGQSHAAHIMTNAMFYIYHFNK